MSSLMMIAAREKCQAILKEKREGTLINANLHLIEENWNHESHEKARKSNWTSFDNIFED